MVVIFSINDCHVMFKISSIVNELCSFICGKTLSLLEGLKVIHMNLLLVFWG